MMGKQTLRYCGRSFSQAELMKIGQIIDAADRPNRAEIARRVCRQLSWVRPNGELKVMSCRVALLKMHRDRLLQLPEPRNGNGNGKWLRHTQAPQTENMLRELIAKVLPLTVKVVDSQCESQCWNTMMASYHYLGYVPLPGAQLRYLIYTQQQLVAALGFGAAAWKIADRDKWIGWDSLTRSQNLNYIANNNRFLILPHVQVHNLASNILALIARRIADDWLIRYGYRIYLLETFVESGRFNGICYRAANWMCLGRTRGRGKNDRYNTCKLPIKNIYIYPVTKNWKKNVTLFFFTKLRLNIQLSQKQNTTP